MAERHALLVRPTRESQYPKRIRDIPINAIGLSGIRSVARNERPCLLSTTIRLTCENPDGSTRFEIDYQRDTRSDYPSLFIQKPNRTRSSSDFYAWCLYSTRKIFTRRTVGELLQNLYIYICIYMSLFQVWFIERLYEEVMNNECRIFFEFGC